MAILPALALLLIVGSVIPYTANCNSEGDALHALRTEWNDPNNVLQSWDPTLVNPCTWFHVTCNNDNSVIRVDLGNAGLSGSLLPNIGQLPNLQYLELFSNNFTGKIPRALGNLTNLVSLGLNNNFFTGVIPSSLGYLKNLRFLRLNGNLLTGRVPINVVALVTTGNLVQMNISDNRLAGTVRSKTKVTAIIQDGQAI